MGDDSGKLISSNIKLTIGIASIAYGILLYFLANNKIEKITFSFPKILNELPAKVYLVLGVLVLRLDRFLTFISDNTAFIVIQVSIGVAISCYGLNRYLFEKRTKRESGNIEK